MNVFNIKKTFEITLGIAGSAGRKDDAKKLSKKHFESMILVASGLIEELSNNNYPISTIISGGAAWADFVAIQLFLDKKVNNLRLFLPCEWESGSFLSKKEKDEGSILNYYHKQFQMVTGINSLTKMQIAKNEGAEFISCRGFYARNYLVAKSDFLLAMTFGNGAEVKSGGTSHCVKCYLDRVRKEGFFDKSFHYNLNDGKVYEGCTVPKEEKDAKLAKGLAKQLGIPFHQVVGFHASP